MAAGEEGGEGGGEGGGGGAGFVVGQRVALTGSGDGGSRDPAAVAAAAAGTVRYVGPVAGQQGVWVGVEWDDPSRGKHNGSTGGQRYFSSAHPTGASFVRLHKITSGVTFVEALRLKYATDTVQDSQRADDGELYVLTSRQQHVQVELVGFGKIAAKQRQLDQLQRVFLEDCAVATAGSPGEIASTSRKLVELDLSGNLLADWKAADAFGIELPGLRSLNLSRNRLKEWAPASPAPVFQALKILVLNSCKVTWPQVLEVARDVPALEELHLCNNDLKRIQSAHEATTPEALGEKFPNLSLVNFEDNQITDWEELMVLSRLPRLQRLYMSNNRLPKMFISDELLKRGCFQSLSCMLLANNCLEDWTFLHMLDLLPCLEETRLTGNPVSDGHKGARAWIIAQVGKLKLLNSSEVRVQERIDAEIGYVKSLLASTVGQDAEEVDRLHPRLKHLQQLHEVTTGIVQPLSTSKRSLADNLLAVTLVCMAAQRSTSTSVVKKLPCSMTLRNLKLLCERLFRIKASAQILSLQDETGQKEQLADDRETLSSIGVGQGKSIHVDEVRVVVMAPRSCHAHF
eukprot:jgi/Chlat1/7819/Chrsp66S07273